MPPHLPTSSSSFPLKTAPVGKADVFSVNSPASFLYTTSFVKNCALSISAKIIVSSWIPRLQLQKETRVRGSYDGKIIDHWGYP